MGDWGNGAFQDDEAQERAADVVESTEPSVVVRTQLAQFLAIAGDSYDRSESAEEWAPVRGVIALCEVLRLTDPSSHSLPGSRPPATLVAWLAGAGAEFRITAEDRALARRALEIILASKWLRSSNPEIFSDTIVPIHRYFEERA